MDPLQKLAELAPAKRAFSLAEEFKTFAFRGSVIDLAIGVVIGAAFGNVVNSLVKNLLLPLISLLLPADKRWEHWSFWVGGKEVPYGLFLGDALNFVIVALAVFFFVVKFLGWVLRFRQEAAAAAPPLTKQEALLTEIRDLLKTAKAPV
jgi:large conductance mechanosensitive channel